LQNDDPAKRIKYGVEDYPGTSENTIAWNAIDAASNLTLTNATKAKVNEVLNQLKITGYIDRT